MIILHHYDLSPYGEKIRLMFGLTNTSWQSLLSPARPPRPNLDPLTGGYRRIPVAQIGADIFCDTQLIAEEVADLSGHKGLDPKSIDGEALGLMNRAEKEAFFAAVGAVPPLRLLVTMWQKLGPLEIIPFIKDRTGMLKTGTQKPIGPNKSQHILEVLLQDLETRLADNQWVAGENATVADFSVYHPLWLYANFNRKPLDAGPNVKRWFKAVADIGHGHREDISQAYAFQIAKVSSPRALPEKSESNSLPMNKTVQVAPEDYGTNPVTGVLVSASSQRIILARENPQFGTLHVHFPADGYAVKEV